MARRIASAASDHENENRRMFVRAVARAVRKWSSAVVGTSGALSSSRAKTGRPKRAGRRPPTAATRRRRTPARPGTRSRRFAPVNAEAPAVGARGLADPADAQRARRAAPARRVRARAVWNRFMTTLRSGPGPPADSRDGPPERKSVQRRSIPSHQRKARTNGHDDVVGQGRVEVAALQGEAVQPGARPARHDAAPRPARPRQPGADGVLQRAVVLQQGRCADELERPQAGVAEDVDQRDVPEDRASSRRRSPRR